MCKQLSRPVLKSLKRSGPKSEKKKICGVVPRPKFCNLLRAGATSGRNFDFSFGPGPGGNFYLYFGPDRTETAIFAGRDRKIWPVRTSSLRLLCNRFGQYFKAKFTSFPLLPIVNPQIMSIFINEKLVSINEKII